MRSSRGKKENKVGNLAGTVEDLCAEQRARTARNREAHPPAASPAARGGTSGSHLPEWQGDRKWRRCWLVLGPEEGTRAGTRLSGSSERLKRNPPTPQPLRALTDPLPL